MNNHIPILSFFSGAGGLDLGFEQAGFEILAAYDISPAAIKTYNYNREKQMARSGDISHLDAKRIVSDLNKITTNTLPLGIIGGPPCQAFSRSNVYPRQDDIRRTLPGHFARLLGELKQHYPIKFFVFENVQGLTYERHKEEFERFRFLFDEAGFHLHEALLNAKNFGVAQDRPRVFIVGFDKYSVGTSTYRFSFPKPMLSLRTVRQAFTEGFGHIPYPDPAFYRRDLKSNEIPIHPNHWTMMPKSAKFHNGKLHEGEIKGRSFRVLSWDRPSWTVAYGHREIHVHPSGTRRLSIFEAMLLQGFPIDYVLQGTLSDQVTLISDAVPVPLARAIAQSIFDTLKHTESQIIEGGT